MTTRAWALAILAAFAGGFLAGRWSIPMGKPVQIAIGPSKALPERNLSPKGEVRTVIVTRTVPGAPAAPPVPVPADLGQHLQTTDVTLPMLTQGAVLHDALFGQFEGSNLVLRNVHWLDTPTGRVDLPDSTTVTARTTFTLPPAPALPRWTVAALPAVKNGRMILGGLVEHQRGPLVLGVGHLDRQTFGIIGARW